MSNKVIVKRTSKRLMVEHDHGRFDRLLRLLSYRVGGKRYCAKEGMLTDYSSTPGFYDAIVESFRVKFAGVIHDSLYKHAVDCDDEPVSRADADVAWRLIAQVGKDSANAFQAWLGYIGLRAGGWRTWNRYRKAEKSLKENGLG